MSVRLRVVWPLLLGVVLGSAALMVGKITHGADFLAAQTGESSFNVAFPQSIPVYLTGAVLPEAIYHILPLPLLFLLTQRVMRTEAGRSRAFYVITALVALIEPALQGGGILGLARATRGTSSSRSSYPISSQITR